MWGGSGDGDGGGSDGGDNACQDGFSNLFREELFGEIQVQMGISIACLWGVKSGQ